jgi:GT2 family glycosyltransferase
MNFPKVFIIILNYNGKEFIKKMLSSVLRINYPNFEVVLVDNNSKDGSFEFVKREFSKITLIKNSENLGFSAGNNIGIEYALERGAKYILLLNYDTEVEKKFLTPLIETMEGDEKIGIASPIIMEEGGLKIWFSGGRIDWFKMKSFHENNDKKNNYFGSSYLSGCTMLIRSEVFRQIGLFDEDYFLYWEDVDFSVRAKKAGFRLVICPQSRIIHLEKSQEKKERKIYWLVISGLIFFKKNSPFILKPYIFFYTFLRKLKNWKDRKREKTALNEAVQTAYKDFKYVK